MSRNTFPEHQPDSASYKYIFFFFGLEFTLGRSVTNRATPLVYG